MIVVFLTAFLHYLCDKIFIRILCIQGLLDRAQLFGNMPWILLFCSVDKMLDVITIPFAAKALYALNLVSGVLFPMSRKLVDAAFTLAEVMRAAVHHRYGSFDNSHITHGLESIAAGYGILAGLYITYGRVAIS